LTPTERVAELRHYIADNDRLWRDAMSKLETGSASSFDAYQAAIYCANANIGELLVEHLRECHGAATE